MDRAKFYAALRRRESGLFGTKLSQAQDPQRHRQFRYYVRLACRLLGSPALGVTRLHGSANPAIPRVS